MQVTHANPLQKGLFPLWPVWQSTKERRPSLRGPFNQGARFVAVAVINAPRPPLIPTLYVIIGIGRPNRGQMTVKIKYTIVIASHNERAITRRKGSRRGGETELARLPFSQRGRCVSLTRITVPLNHLISYIQSRGNLV